MGNSFELRLHPPAAELVLQHKTKMLLLLTGGVCILGGDGESVATKGQMSGSFYPALQAPSGHSRCQCLVAGVWMVLRLSLAVTAVAGEGEAGCNPW